MTKEKKGSDSVPVFFLVHSFLLVYAVYNIRNQLSNHDDDNNGNSDDNNDNDGYDTISHQADIFS